MFIIQFIRGFCMALADSVPGVSGGTIAFLLGFYDKFIDSIDDLLTGTKEERKDAFVFLIKLGIGWISGFVIAVLILTSVFEPIKRRYRLCCLVLRLYVPSHILIRFPVEMTE